MPIPTVLHFLGSSSLLGTRNRIYVGCSCTKIVNYFICFSSFLYMEGHEFQLGYDFGTYVVYTQFKLQIQTPSFQHTSDMHDGQFGITTKEEREQRSKVFKTLEDIQILSIQLHACPLCYR